MQATGAGKFLCKRQEIKHLRRCGMHSVVCSGGEEPRGAATYTQLHPAAGGTNAHGGSIAVHTSPYVAAMENITRDRGSAAYCTSTSSASSASWARKKTHGVAVRTPLHVEEMQMRHA